MADPGRPQTGEHNPYFSKYIDLVPDDDIRMLIRVQLADTLALLRPISEAKAGHRYAEGKWSIKQVVGHLIDAERVFLRSEEHTSELQSQSNLVCRLLLEKKKKKTK